MKGRSKFLTTKSNRMKVEIKLSADALLACNKLLQNVYDTKRYQSQTANMMLSITFDLADKLDSKSKTIMRKQGLFDTKKTHKISFKFHEARALEAVIRSMLPNIDNDYQATLLTGVANKLNQQNLNFGINDLKTRL